MQNKQLCFVGPVSSSRRLDGIKRSEGRWGETQPAAFQRRRSGCWGQRRQRGDCVQGKRGSGEGRKAPVPDPVAPFTPRCAGTIADSAGSQHALCGTGVETKGERGKQVHFPILVQQCAVGAKPAPAPATLNCSDNRGTSITKMSFHCTLPHRRAMWSPRSFPLSHMEFPPSLHLILCGCSKSISLVL